MLKIKQNWGKIANYPPNAQQRSVPLLKMVLCERANWRMKRHKTLQKIVVFISDNISDAGGTNCKALNHPES